MVRVALRDLAGRKFRTALTALAIVLGVAMVAGTFVLTDTIQKAFENLFEDSYANTDVVVSGKDFVDFSSSGGPTVPASLLGKIRDLNTVEAASGGIEDFAKLLDRKGKPIVTGGAPTLAFSTDPDYQQFNPLKLTAGDWPSGPNEVVIDKGTADKKDFAVGDRIRVATRAPVRSFTISGIARFGTVDSIGGATFAIFDVPTAQSLFDKQGVFDGIQVAAAPGVSPQQLAAEIRPLLPPTVQAQTATAQAESDSDDTDEGISYFRYFLLVFGGIALFVGAFVIFNTLSITVAQRTREFATLRTIGASRRQLLASVLIESFVIGALAAVAGLGAGIGLARLLNWVFIQFDLDLPQTTMVIAPRTIVYSLVIGIVVTVAAGVFPALRATRVPPIAAVREGAVLPRSRLAALAPYLAVLTVLVAVLVLGYGLFADDVPTRQRLFALGGGCLSLFIGVALVSSRIVRPVSQGSSPVATAARMLLFLIAFPFWILPFWLLRFGAFASGGPGTRIGALLAGLVLNPVVALIVLGMWIRSLVTRWRPDWPVEFPVPDPDVTIAGIARHNAARNPGRTAVTAAALMIGLALVTFVAVLGQGLRASVVDTIEQQVRADYVLGSADGFSTMPAGAGEALAGLPIVERETAIRAESARLGSGDVYLSGIDPATIAGLYRFDWEDGSDAILAGLGENGAIVTDDVAKDKNLTVGDRFSITSPNGTRAELVVRGIYKPPALGSMLGDVSITQRRWDEIFPEKLDLNVYVDVRGGPSPAAKEALERAAAEFPAAEVQTRDEFIDTQQAGVNILLNMLYVLLALSVIVSLFGMINTMALSVFERTRELGMLRAIGMTRAQVRRMVRHESIITALIGATLGLPLGVFLAGLVTKALSDEGVVFRVPIGSLVVFAVVAVFAGLLAAILPARRAARLNVLQALQYE